MFFFLFDNVAFRESHDHTVCPSHAGGAVCQPTPRCVALLAVRCFLCCAAVCHNHCTMTLSSVARLATCHCQLQRLLKQAAHPCSIMNAWVTILVSTCKFLFMFLFLISSGNSTGSLHHVCYVELRDAGSVRGRRRARRPRRL